MLVSFIKKLDSFLKKYGMAKSTISSIKITSIYLIIGLLWIYVSDKIKMSFSPNALVQGKIELYKGLAYIIITSLILYLLIKDKLKRVQDSEEELRAQYLQLKENELLLTKSEANNKAIIQAIPDLIFIIDKDGYFLDCKANDNNQLLIPKELFIGKTIKDVMPDHISAGAYEKLKVVINTGGLESIEYSINMMGSIQYYELRMAKSGENEVLAIARNVTVEREREKLLLASEDKYKTLVTEMQQGIALYEMILTDNDVEFIFIDANESHEKILGINKADSIGKNILEVMPDLSSEYIEKYKQVVMCGEHIHYERFSKMAEKYIEVVAYKPKELQLALIVGDISQRKAAEEALEASENTFRSLFESSSDGILLFKGDIIIDCNAAMVEILKYKTKGDILSKTPQDLSPDLQPDGLSSKEKIISMRKDILKNKKSKFEWWCYRNDGLLVAFEIMLTPIMLNGNLVYHCLCRDVGERKKMEQKLEYLSFHDQLTGLYNRRFFEEELMRLDVKKNYPLTIIMADVNGLKLINDSFGHAIGDELLKKVANIFVKGCRACDVVARLGGDEFVIILPKTDGFEGEGIVKRIKEIASTEKVDSIDISVSLGYETKKSIEDNINEILKKAEDHMYKKKLFESPSMRGKTINTIISTLHEKNKREEQHSKRVSDLCSSMAMLLGLNDEQVQELKTVGLLHDIGKIAIDENILNKPGPLNDDEWEEMKRHPEVGYRILSTVNNMSEMAEFVLAHHERWDGKGYPKGLKEEQIPLQSRIISVVDAYDAMTSRRTYGNMLTKEQAISELKKNSGIQFDPILVELFIDKVL